LAYGTPLYAVAAIVYETMHDKECEQLDVHRACGSLEVFLRVLACSRVDAVHRVWDTYRGIAHITNLLEGWKLEGTRLLERPRRLRMTDLQEAKATFALKSGRNDYDEINVHETQTLFAMRSGLFAWYMHAQMQGAVMPTVLEELLRGNAEALDHFREFIHEVTNTELDMACDFESLEDSACCIQDGEPENKAPITAMMKEVLLLPFWRLKISKQWIDGVMQYLDDPAAKGTWTWIKRELGRPGNGLVLCQGKPVAALAGEYGEILHETFVARAVVLPEPEEKQLVKRRRKKPPPLEGFGVPWGGFACEQFVTLLTHDPVLTSVAFARVSRGVAEKARLASCMAGFFKRCAFRTVPHFAKEYSRRMTLLRDERQYLEIISHPQGSRDLAENWFWRKVFVTILNRTFSTHMRETTNTLSNKQTQLVKDIESGKVVTGSMAFGDPWVFQHKEPRLSGTYSPRFLGSSTTHVEEREPLRIPRQVLDKLPKTHEDIARVQLQGHEWASWKCYTARRPEFLAHGGTGTIVPDFSSVKVHSDKITYDLNVFITPRVTLNWNCKPRGSSDYDLGAADPGNLLVDFDNHLLPAVPWM